MTMRFLSSGLLASTLALAIPDAAARMWPDSTAQIVVFSDQLPPGLTAAQRQFAATNLAGTQKMRRTDIQALRVYNTNFLCLHYQLGVGNGPELFLDGDAWTSDWNFVTTQTNWFMLNAQTQRVYHTTWNWYLMDCTYTGGLPRTGFPNYWITTCLARIRSTEGDGVFADSFTQDAYSFGFCNPSHPWIENLGLCVSNWIPALHSFGGACKTAFEADPGGFLYLPNLGGLITSWDPTDFGLGHGGMIEGFCYWGTGNYFDRDDWRLQMDRALSLVRTGKTVICQSYPDTSAYSDRRFAVASYLLIKGARTYLCLLTTGDVALEYYPEYTIALGGATSPPPASTTSAWHGAWGVYRRGYTNGWTLVNPGGSAVVIPNLGGTFHRVTASGGGAVDGAGNYGGSLSYTPVTSLTVAAYSGEVLLFQSQAPSNTQPAALSAVHRSGQTFITWRERSDLSGERYRVYRHTAPISATNLAQAVPLYTLQKGSARFHANRYNIDGGGAWTSRYTERLVITNGGPQLGVSTGLLVWTLATNDFGGGTTGSAYYAVTLLIGATENTGDFSAANSIGPVAEGVADPLPVLVTNFPASSGPYGNGGPVRIYIQYMDLRNWNPTFHAPHSRNGWYGQSGLDPAVTGAIQYAYDYAVVEPSCVTSPAPTYISLHGWAGNTYGPVTADPDAYDWCCYKIFPVDVSETWFFGFARNCDYRTDAEPAAGDSVENFTERRVLRMLYDLIRQPPGPPVDTNRVYVFGGSMGGSGALALALRYPHVFAAAYASQPMTDYSTQGDAGGTPWKNDIGWKWGTVGLNLPVRSDAMGGWADALKAWDGTGVWTWQNHRRTASNAVARAAVPLGIGHGTNDFIIEWPTQGRPVYPAFNAGRRCWGGAVIDAGHSWMGWNGLPPTIAPDGSLAPFRRFAVRKDESVPGLSNAEGDAPLPPAGPGGYNQDLDWSASWYDWDGAPTDTTNLWQVSLRSLNGETQAVDVTARRLQRFPVAPGTRVLWRNLRVANGTTSQVGVAAADSEGLITVPQVQVTPDGNRLRLDADVGPDSDGDGIRDYWEDAFGFSIADTNDAAADADGDRAPNLDEYRAGTLPRDASSVFRISGYGNGGLAWNGAPGFRYALETTPDLAASFGPYRFVTAASARVEADVPYGDATSRFWRVGIAP